MKILRRSFCRPSPGGLGSVFSQVQGVKPLTLTREKETD